MSRICRIFLTGIVPIALLAAGAEVLAQDDVDCSGCVETKDIKFQAVTTNKIAKGAVSNAKLAKKSVTNAKVAKNAVTSNKIKNGAVTISKVSPELSNSIGTFCTPGETVVGKDVNGNYVCEPASSPMTPAVTGAGIDGTGNIEFRCREWSGDVCVRPQARVLATSCGTYQDVDVWHDMTASNSPAPASCPSFCKAVTGDESVVSCTAGIETATSSPNGYVATSDLDASAGCLANNDYRWRMGGAFQAVDPNPAALSSCMPRVGSRIMLHSCMVRS